MKQNKVAMKTMAIKARVFNYIRKELYDYSDRDYDIKYKNKKDISNFDRNRFFADIYVLFRDSNSELRNYKRKRQDKAELHQKRLNSPLTKSMKKKLYPVKHTFSKINLVNS